MISCPHCKTEFNCSQLLITHNRSCESNPYRNRPKHPPEVMERIGRKLKERAIEAYYKNPKKCAVCEGTISFECKTRKTCSAECFSILQANENKRRNLDPEYRNKRRNTLLTTIYGHCDPDVVEHIRQNKPAVLVGRKRGVINIKYNYRRDLKHQYATSNEYTKIWYNNCSHCGAKFLLPMQRKYCSNCTGKYGANGRNRYTFTFNIYEYPELFNLDMINHYKWRCSETNPNGVTRDHRVSVNEAIRNNYDPFYIKHPLNCELMLFIQNNLKKTKSSISYEELVKLVDEWELKRKN